MLPGGARVSCALAFLVAQTLAGQAAETSPVPPDSEIRKMLVDRIDANRQSVGIVVGVAYTWRALQKAFFSDMHAEAHVHEHGHELAAITWPEVTGVSLLLFASLVVGLYPRVLLDAIEPTVKALLAGGVQ